MERMKERKPIQRWREYNWLRMSVGKETGGSNSVDEVASERMQMSPNSKSSLVYFCTIYAM